MSEQILLYRSGALGDTLLTLPALEELRRHFPGARLTLAAHPSYAAPLKDADRVDAILDASSVPFHLLHQNSTDGGDDLDRLLGDFDIAVLYTGSAEGGAVAHRLNSNFPGRWILSPPFPPDGKQIHVTDWMVHALNPLGIAPGRNTTAPLRPSKESRASARRLLQDMGLEKSPFLGIHPGGGGRAKWPPPEALARIVKDFCRKDPARPFLIPQPFLIRGPADEEACAAFLAHWGDALPTLETPRLEILAGALAESGACLGSDSGVTHLAALCGVPTLALFGPASNPDQWAPIGDRCEWTPWDQAQRGADNLKRLVFGKD